MSAVDDDVTDPLAGIDLKAWQPPPAGPAPVDAIIARALDGTRVDGRAAVELEPDAPVPRPRAQRTRWLAVGFMIGAAAAALLAIALWPLDTTRTVTVAVPTPSPIWVPPTPPPTRPAGTVGPTLEQCKAFGERSDWDGMIACATSMPVDDPEAKALIATARQAKDDAENKRIADEHAKNDRRDYDFTGTCDADKLLDAARDAGGSGNYGKMLKKAQASDDCKASKTARKLALLAACRVGNVDVAQGYWQEFSTDTGMQQVCAGVVGPIEICDAKALLDEARTAGSANQWNKVLAKSEAANKCSSSKIARQLALLAACQLGNKDKALKYWKEFEANQGMQQRCMGVIK